MTDVNYELYKVFYHVAKSLSFSDAAADLFISQSAVSQSIKVLERRLGQTLFVRSTKKVSLTREGELLFKHIEPAIGLITKAENQLSAAKESGEVQFKIAASDTICRYFLVPYFNEFHKKYPDIHIRVINASSSGCAALLEENKVDLIVSNYPNPTLNSTMKVVPIADFKDMFVADRSAFPFEGKEMNLRALSKYPILMLDKHSTTSVFLHELFQKSSIDLVPSIEVASNDLLIDLAEIGLGIAFVPDYSLKTKTNSSLYELNVTEKIPARRIVAAYDDSAPLNDPAQYFIDIMAKRN